MNIGVTQPRVGSFKLSEIMNPGPLMMSTSDMSSDEKLNWIRVRRSEEDPSKVDFHFLKTGTKIVFHASSKCFLLTGKSSKEGVLITYNVFMAALHVLL